MNDYTINIIAGFHDNFFRLVNCLHDFLIRHPAEFSSENSYVITKDIHPDITNEKHFTFKHNGITYHAYVKDVKIMVNNKPHYIKYYIYKVTRLEIIY